MATLYFHHRVHSRLNTRNKCALSLASLFIAYTKKAASLLKLSMPVYTIFVNVNEEEKKRLFKTYCTYKISDLV